MRLVVANEPFSRVLMQQSTGISKISKKLLDFKPSFLMPDYML
jgi:hypothetical protein